MNTTHIENIGCCQSLGLRAELLTEGGIGESEINILKYINTNSLKSQGYTIEILKCKDTNLLISEQSLAYYKSSGDDITFSQYENKNGGGGMSNFIRGQVTGESFIMTEVNGSGLLRLSSKSSLLELKRYQKTRFSILNTNIYCIEAILGSFSIASPQKIKTNQPIIYSEITLNDALMVLETGELYEVNITTDAAININPTLLFGWTGNLLLDTSSKETFKFSGMGQVYLLISPQ